MSLYFLGDIHGDPFTAFSFSKNKWLKNLTENDVVIQLGDFGCIWDYKGSKEDKNKMQFVASKPWTTIIVCGNHENYDIIEKMPMVEKFGGKCHQAVYMNEKYENIFFVDYPTIFNIDEKHILCIPKAESHDIWNLLDPNDENFKSDKKALDKNHQWYRVIGQTWWPQEKMNVREFDIFVDEHADEHFDYVCTHDAPGRINSWYISLGYFDSTEGERYLEALRQTLDFDIWVHGHYHFTSQWPMDIDSRILSIGNDDYLYSEDDVKDYLVNDIMTLM